MRYAILLSLAIGCGLAGCAPIPHFERTQPEIDGVVSVAGVPRAGVEVSACLGYPAFRASDAPEPGCERRVSTTTDAQGRFHLEGFGHVRLMMAFLGDPVWRFGVTASDAGRESSWHRGGIGSPPAHVDLQCTFAEKLDCGPEIS